MTGGIIQLVSYGIENIYLTEDPQITFFKTVYRRHTNFSIESIQQFFNVNGSFGEKITCNITKNGDLINKVYIVIDLPEIPKINNGVVRWVNYIGWNIIKSVEIEIGGKIIDRHLGEYMYIMSKLNKNNNDSGLDKMIGNVPELYEFSDYKPSYRLYVPLYFWFCKNSSLSLPIMSLDFTDIKINVELNELSKCLILGPSHQIIIDDTIPLYKPYELIKVNNEYYIQYINYDRSKQLLSYIKTNNNKNLSSDDKLIGLESKYESKVYNINSNKYNNIKINKEIFFQAKSNSTFRNVLNVTLNDIHLIVDFVYLENIERLKFSKSNHEYLIEIVQYDNDKICFNANNKIKLGYSHPTKEIIVRSNLDYIHSSYFKDQFNFSTDILLSKPLIKNLTIKLNGINREMTYDKYFHQYIQSYQHHNDHLDGVFIYSFSIDPTDINPSGTCNFSRIDDITLNITLDPIVSYNNTASVRVYTLTYNILRIIDGIGGLAFE